MIEMARESVNKDGRTFRTGARFWLYRYQLQNLTMTARNLVQSDPLQKATGLGWKLFSGSTLMAVESDGDMARTLPKDIYLYPYIPTFINGRRGAWGFWKTIFQWDVC